MNNIPDELQKIVKEVDKQIAPKLAEIEEQIKFYEDLRQSLLVEVEKIGKKMNSLREYLDGLE